LSLYLAVILGYSVLQVLLGLWIGRRVKTSGDFFVAGRRLGPGLLFSSLMAANIGAGSTVGASGLAYRDGLSAWWWVGSAGLGSLVLAFTVGPRIRRLAAEHDLLTVGDYLEHRYHRGVRGLVAALLWVGTLALLAGQLIAVAWVLNVVAGVPKPAGCLIGGIVMTSYFAAGGLLTSARVNAVQLAVEGVGFVLLAVVALSVAGGWGAVRVTAAPVAGYWDFWGGGPSGAVYLALLAPAFVVSPGLLQKVYGARDDHAVRLGVGLNALGLLAFAAVPVLLGLCARLLHPGLPNQELALPTLLLHDLPPLLGALGLAALFSAEVNTADAILFMLSTSLSQDLYRRFVNPQASDAQVLRVARWAAVLGGALGVGLAMAAPSVIGVLSIFYSLLTVSLFVPLVAGLYLRRVGTPEALAAIGGGVGVLLLVHFPTGGKGLGLLSPVLAGLLAAAAACAAVAAIRGRARGIPSGA
jgi:SSS family solute:Na+ symporter